jgi:hypothetical protein
MFVEVEIALWFRSRRIPILGRLIAWQEMTSPPVRQLAGQISGLRLFGSRKIPFGFDHDA